ncbi:HupE/UreJ family protein [Sedimenticola selenatireducens]|uniref:HupE/UreJ family protein n=1 Tax=Sedimenticola selenatireducens TaxID=191960 RepID=A0A557SCG7_9GAMM|nr:HupE/UreJ family protein [Sedimenticola selenatireducens]TVO75096.1 HupE/UreJ family protein [Sedimenticola selenatireducens]TVT67050.1 MAG: HupE/UreJ family protein [Sedimenticola selenatireducens]
MLVIRHLLMLISGIVILLVLSDASFAHGMSEEEKQAVIAGGNLRYLWLGATHMLSGYDHLAFVFGIIFFLTSFRDIAKYVTAFTLGHSVTLIYATFNGIQLNYFLIDAIIALSVCYIAFANLDGFRKYLNINPPNMMFMIVGLGLIHGFGLSTRLQQLPLSEDDLLANIISFNVGVELGQISALAVMLLLVAAWRKRKSFTTFSFIANYTLIMGGLFLFLMQMHGYEHVANASELGGTNTSAVTEADKGTEDPVSTGATETISITLPPRGEKEYKLYLTKGAVLTYSWKTDGEELYYDFHGEPAGDTTGAFKSYQTNTMSSASGQLLAPFEGTHGWYWKSSSNSIVTITLNVQGGYSRLDDEKKGAVGEPLLGTPTPEKKRDSIF